jgi:hypothetical protein
MPARTTAEIAGMLGEYGRRLSLAGGNPCFSHQGEVAYQLAASPKIASDRHALDALCRLQTFCCV